MPHPAPKLTRQNINYRVLISIRTEIIEGIECPLSAVETEPIPPINEASFERNEEFFLFSSIFEANMIDKRLTDKPLQFELSIGNSGNSLDGHNESVKRAQDLDVDLGMDINIEDELRKFRIECHFLRERVTYIQAHLEYIRNTGLSVRRHSL